MNAKLTCLAGLLAATATPPVAAQTPAAPDSRDAIVCQLLDNCTDAAAPVPAGTPRRSSTRGFSFTRPNAAPASAGRVAGSATPKPRATAKSSTTAPGQYDLRVTFVTGSDVVSAASRDRIRAFAGALNDPRLASQRILIEGHTDSVGDPGRNLDLSRRRAQAVADQVVANGVDVTRLDVQGYGQSRPLPGLPGTAGANRRVVASLAK